MEQNKNTIETLEEQPKMTDIPTTSFRPIEEIKEEQENILKSYEEQQHKKSDVTIPDLSGDVRKLEHELAKKKNMVSIPVVLLLIVVVNVCWFLGVRFLIVPKYEKYVEQSDEIKANYDDLKSKVDAIVGE